MAQQRIWCLLLVAGMVLGAASCGDSEVPLPANEQPPTEQGGEPPEPASNETTPTTRLFARDGKSEEYFPVMDALEAAHDGSLERLKEAYHPTVRDEISSEQRWNEALELWELNLEMVRSERGSEDSSLLPLRGRISKKERGAPNADLTIEALGYVRWPYAVEQTPDGWKLLDPLGSIGEDIPHAKPLKEALHAARDGDIDAFANAYFGITEKDRAMLPYGMQEVRKGFQTIGNSLESVTFEYRGGPDAGRLRVLGEPDFAGFEVIRVNGEWKLLAPGASR